MGFGATLHDPRFGGPAVAPGLDPDNWSRSQALGAALRAAGSDGVAYPSRRHPGGDRAGLFYSDLAREPIQGRHLRYHWNGETVDLYRDASDGAVFRIA